MATHSSILVWENHRGAWWATIHGGPKESDTTEHTHTHTQATTSTSIHEVWFVDKRTQSSKGISPSPKAQEPGVVLFKGKKKCCPVSSRKQIHVSSTLLFYAGPQQVSVHPH